MRADVQALDEKGEISLRELRERLGDAALVLLDVRTAEAYAAAHIPHALSLPLADLRVRASTSLPDRGAKIAIYCAGPT